MNIRTKILYIYQYQMYTYRMHRVYIGYAYPIKNSKKIAKVSTLAINVLLFPPSIKRTGVAVSVFPSACNGVCAFVQELRPIKGEQVAQF